MNVLKSIYILLFMVFSIMASAQVGTKKEASSTNKRKDSYDFFERSKSKVDIKSNLSKAERISSKDPSKAIELIQEALISSKLEGDNGSEAKCYELLGSINYTQKQYDLAAKNYRKSTGLYKGLDNKGKYYSSLLWLSKASLQNNSLAEAKSSSTLLISLTSDKVLLSDAQEVLGEVAYTSGNFDLAIKHFQMQEQYEKALLDPKQSTNYRLSRAQANIAKVYAVKNDFKSADKKLLESVTNISADSIYSVKEIMVDEDIEEINDKLELSTEASDYYEIQEEVYKNIRSSSLPSQEIELRNKVMLNQQEDEVSNTALQKQNLGEAYLQSRDYDNAVVNLTESANFKWERSKIANKAKSLKLLSEALSKSGRNQEALEKYQAYVEAQEQVLESNAQNTLKSNRLVAQQNAIEIIEKEFDLYQSELNLLKEREQSADQKYRTQKMVNYGLWFVLGLIAIGGYFIYKNAKEKRKSNQMLALKSLRSQMNPHFIFNALNSVNSFISKNDERSANKFLTDFSKLMRMVLDSSHEDLIPLTQELNVIELYLKLEQYRFRDKFDYDLVVSEEIDQDNFMIPPMLIQPFIENAVWHGLRYKKDFGKLKVVIKELSNQIEVVVEDNGIGRQKSAELKTKNQSQNTSRGLQNTKERIKVINELYDTKLNLTVTDLIFEEEECGTRIKLTIPKIGR